MVASNLSVRVTLALIAITFAVIQSDGLILATIEAQGSGRIAFKSDRDGNSEIYVMDADGSNQVNLTNNPATDSLPSWSPDGSKIAFSSDRGQPGEAEMFVMDADGSNQTGLTNNTASDGAPSWSPDGSKIAFTSTRDGNCGPLCEEIYVMGADGTNQTRLTNNGERETSASWSPDGTRIAFISTRIAQPKFDAWVMDADGTNLMRLTTDLDVNSVRWFPGASIVFTSNLDGDFEIYSIEADGSNLTKLTDNSATDLDPTWSAHGRIAFISDRDVGNEVYVMDDDGSNVTRLTNNSSGERWPSWEPVSATTSVPSLNLWALVVLGGLMAAGLGWRLNRTKLHQGV